MSLSGIQLTALKSELLTDPETLNYAGAADAQAKAVLINDPTLISRERVVIQTHEIFEAIVPADMPPIGESLTKLMGLLSMGTVNTQGTNTRALLIAIFTGKATTLANLATLQTETISRASDLGFGLVTAHEIEIAEAL